MVLQAVGGVLAGLNVFSEGSGIHLAKLSSFLFNKPLTGAEGEEGYRDKTFAENALKISKGRTSDKSQLGFAEKLWLVGETFGDIFWHSQDDWKNYREAPLKYQYFWEAPWMALELMIPGAAILKSAKALSKTEGTGLLAKLTRNVAAPTVKAVGKVETAQEAILPGAFKLLGGATKATAKATKKVTNVSWEKLAQISGVTNKVLKNVTDQFSDLRPLGEVVAYATKKDAARVLGNIVPPLRNFIVGASGQTQTPIHKLNTALNHRASEISAKADLRVRKLEQNGSLKKVFGLDADNRINLPNIKEHPTFFDVANNPKGHKKVIDQMTDAQKSTLLQFQKEYSNITAFLRIMVLKSQRRTG